MGRQKVEVIVTTGVETVHVKGEVDMDKTCNQPERGLFVYSPQGLFEYENIKIVFLNWQHIIGIIPEGSNDGI